MRNFKPVAVVLMFVLAGLAGCGSQEGETVFTAGPNSAEVKGTAPKAGTYLLFTSMSPNPTLTVKLNQGDPIGFHKTDDGRIQAFWLDQSHTLDKGTTQAYWKFTTGS